MLEKFKLVKNVNVKDEGRNESDINDLLIIIGISLKV